MRHSSDGRNDVVTRSALSTGVSASENSGTWTAAETVQVPDYIAHRARVRHQQPLTAPGHDWRRPCRTRSTHSIPPAPR